MPRPRFRRLRRPIEWQRRLQLRRFGAPLSWLALALVILLVVGGVAGSVRQVSMTQAPTPTAEATSDPLAMAVSAAVDTALTVGQVKPALPSSVLYATATAVPTPVPPTATEPPPTDTATPTPLPTATVTPEYILSDARIPVVDWEVVSYYTRPVARPAAALLEPMEQVYQGRDPNDAPSVAAMVLSFYGVEPETVLAEARRALPYDRASQTAPPGLLVRYFQQRRLQALIYEDVTLAQVQQLIAHGVPVVVAQHMLPNDKTPHYRVIRGYSDRRGVVIANDPEFAGNLSFSYAEYALLAKAFDNFTMPVFLPRQLSVVRAILGEKGDKTKEYVELGRKLGEPSPEKATPTATPRPDNRVAENAWPLTVTEVLTGTIQGDRAGAFGYLKLPLEGDGRKLRLELKYSPDDAIISRGVGLNVYDPTGKLLVDLPNSSGRPGERTLRFTDSISQTRLLQVYNYLPDFTVNYTVTLSLDTAP